MAVSAVTTVADVIDVVSHTYTYITQAADTGLYSIVDTVLDVDLAIKNAELTELQLETIYLRWVVGKTLETIAEEQGVTTVAVFKREATARKKIEVVLARWAEDDI